MRWSRPVALLMAAALSSCTFGDKSEPTKIEQLPDNEFKFEVREEADGPANEEEAEAARIAQLEKYLAEHGLCPKGYVIKEKFPVVAEDDPLGQEHVIVYHGTCK
jgi:hypothetical protein